MRAARDTFLHFLADNLAYPIHPVRRDPDDPSADRILSPAVNVQFIGDRPSNSVGVLNVYIDVVADNELDAVDMVQAVSDLLCKRYFTEKFDYTDDANPVATGTTLGWEPTRVVFRPVWDENFFRSRCSLDINHHH